MYANPDGKSRSRSQRNLAMRGRLTPRDRDVIRLVALHGAATRNQLIGLGFFASVSRANRRLKHLFDTKHLRRAYIAAGANSVETVYVLGPMGVPIAAELAVIEKLELERQSRRQPERAYLEHQIGILAVRISMLNGLHCLDVVEFLTEPECRHEYLISKAKQVSKRLIKPDAFFEVRSEHQRGLFFLEFDRGHCSLPQMRGVFERYGAYARDGAFRSAYLEDDFDVLVVTTAGKGRIAHLANVAKNCGVEVRFAKFADVRSQGFFAQIWQASAEDSLSPLMDAPSWRHQK